MKKLNFFLCFTSSILFFVLLTLTNAQEVEDLRKTINTGISLMEKGRFDEAIAIHEKLITLDSNDFIAYMDLGVALSEKGLWGEGMNQLKKSLAINPFNPLVRANLGYTYYKMKKWQEAFDEFNYSWNINEGEPVAQEGLKKTLKEGFSEIEKWTKEKPADPFAHYYLAYALCFKDKPKKAMEEIEKAIELDKSKAQFYDAKGYFLYWQENYKESIEAYKECIAKDPSYWRAYNMISKNYLGKKELKEALDIMLKAVNINPNIISIQTNLADVYAKIDDFERAIIANKKAISLEAMFYGRPKDPITQLNLAVCYFNLKNYEMAWRYARIAERMGFLDAKKVIKELKRVSKEPE